MRRTVSKMRMAYGIIFIYKILLTATIKPQVKINSMPVSQNLLHEAMYQNSEAPFFDCYKFKQIVHQPKASRGLLERLNAWCDKFTGNKKREIYQELETLKKVNAQKMTEPIW